MGIQMILLTATVAAAVAMAAPPTSPPPQYPAQAEPHYQFEYSVLDEAARLDFGHQEQRDAAETTGSYRVLLPDGRRQSVTYSVLGPDGYLADVTYEGEPVPYQLAAAAPRYGPARGPASRPRTYTLQSATEAPLAAVAETTPAVAEPEYVQTVSEQIEAVEIETVEAVEENVAEEQSDDEMETAETDTGAYGTKLQSEEQAEAQPEAEQETKAAYQPRPQPRYTPRYYPQYAALHYPRYYPRYRPAARARTYYTQREETAPEAPAVLSVEEAVPATPAVPSVETVSNEESAAVTEAEQTYGAQPAAAAGAVLESGEVGSESGEVTESVTEVEYGARLAGPEQQEPTPTAAAASEPTTPLYGARLAIEEETETVTETPGTEGPIYRQDTL